MTLRIMPLNMRKLRRLPKRLGPPIQIPQPAMQIRIPAPHIPNIRLKMLHIHHIEPNNCRKESYIRFRDRGAVVIGPVGNRREMCFCAVEGCEERGAGGGVGGGGGGEAGFVDAIVDGVVGPGICCFDFFSQMFWKQIHLLVLVLDDVVELSIPLTSPPSLYPCFWQSGSGETTYLRIKHPNNLTTLITHNLPLLNIIQQRHRKPPLIPLINAKINLPQKLRPVNRIRPYIRTGRIVVFGCSEPPAFGAHVPVHACVGDDVLEAFELAHDEGAVRPGACVGDLLAEGG